MLYYYNKYRNLFAKMSADAKSLKLEGVMAELIVEQEEHKLDEAILQTKIQCKTAEGDKVQVKVALLLMSRTFERMWKDLNLASGGHKDFLFPVPQVSTRTFKKVVEWLKEHLGEPVPVIETDETTNERKWFTLTEYEKNFFDVNAEELAELLQAGNYLDIPSLYLCGCQSLAAIIKEKPAEEICAKFGLEDNLTKDEKEAIKRKNVWCNY